MAHTFKRGMKLPLADHTDIKINELIPLSPEALEGTSFGARYQKTVSELTFEELCSYLDRLSVMQKDDIPLSKLLKDSSGRVKTLVVNGVVTENNGIAPLALLENYGVQIIRAMKIIMSVMGIKRGIIAISQRSKSLRQKLSEIPEESKLVKIERVGDNYPAGNTVLLLYSLSGKELSPLHESYISSYLVLTPKNCLDVYNAFAKGIKPCDEVFAYTDRQGQTNVYSAPLGTPLKDIFEKLGTQKRIVKGSPLSDIEADINKTLAVGMDSFTEKEKRKGVSGLCNKCGVCVEHCPMYLYPYEFISSGRSHAVSCGINVCIQCGLCSTLCPVSYPLGQRIQSLKNALNEEKNPKEEKALESAENTDNS